MSVSKSYCNGYSNEYCTNDFCQILKKCWRKHESLYRVIPTCLIRRSFNNLVKDRQTNWSIDQCFNLSKQTNEKKVKIP